MNSLELSLLSLCLGLILGGGIALLIVVAYRTRDKHLQESSTELPDGLTLVMEGMTDAAAVIDTSNLILATSKAAGWLGFRVGATLQDPELRALVKEARASGVPETHSMRLRIGDVSTETRLVSARAISLGGRLALLTVRDISEAERVERMRHDFVSNTSHELKTPVGAVTLLAEAIESAADDPAQVRHFASRIQAEALRLGNLTSRIMNLSRLQSTDSLAETRAVSIDEVVAAAIDMQSVAAESQGVEVVRGGDRGLYVRGDVQVLSDAIANLIANAIAYSPAGSRVGVGVKQMADAVEISVADRGIGIDESEQNRIFERFYRADQARSRRTGGTGLGLSIVKHAVQRHGGDVRLWSRPGRGSTFTVTLPLIPAPDADERSHKKSGTKGKKAKSGGGSASRPVKKKAAKSAPAAAAASRAEPAARAKKTPQKTATTATPQREEQE
ncbi:hypothetical protein GCM10009860_20610 [Microbacterium mitrae]|uniref:Sensor-like histidine kinase SenX3 n=1 Tax=Microbacterium mitrae TaxID=664640 RepID=A0A5C8HNR1_9MICO|nr:ATP-binding protein [Microbacterium mitrae]TXK04434.1 two-component sensor histidine kinase [Microbacterium mitrae]